MRLSHASRIGGRPGARVRSELGETLIEVLVAITLMGVGFAAVMSGIYTSVRIADTNTRYTRASILVQAYAEAVLQPATDTNPSLYKPCATAYVDSSNPGTYQASGVGLPNYFLPSSTWSARVIKVEYFNGFEQPLTGLYRPKYDQTYAQCTSMPSYTAPSDGIQRDNGLQRLTVAIQSNDPNRPVNDTLVIVKRDRRCPSTFSNADRGPC